MGKLLHNDRFKHVNYHVTNLTKTFARIRKQQAEELVKQKEIQAEADKVVRPIVRRKS